jgi:hypothetical protein
MLYFVCLLYETPKNLLLFFHHAKIFSKHPGVFEILRVFGILQNTV